MDFPLIAAKRLNHWDCFLNGGDKKDLRLNQSGSGGDETDIYAPEWVDGYLGNYWLADCIKLKGEVVNGKRINKPIPFKGHFKSSINPFKVGEIAYEMNYCERCACYSEDYCREHQYEGDDGELRYYDDDSVVE